METFLIQVVTGKTTDLIQGGPSLESTEVMLFSLMAEACRDGSRADWQQVRITDWDGNIYAVYTGDPELPVRDAGFEIRGSMGTTDVRLSEYLFITEAKRALHDIAARAFGWMDYDWIYICPACRRDKIIAFIRPAVEDAWNGRFRRLTAMTGKGYLVLVRAPGGICTGAWSFGDFDDAYQTYTRKHKEKGGRNVVLLIDARDGTVVEPCAA